MFALLRPVAGLVPGPLIDGADWRLEMSSAAELSREIEVNSVDAELKTLAADDNVELELASIELNVEARLCLETVRLSMLRGREAAAVRPGVRVLLLAVDGDAAPDAEDPNFGDEEVEAQMRPKNRDAAVVISSARRASAPLRLAPGPAILAALLDN